MLLRSACGGRIASSSALVICRRCLLTPAYAHSDWWPSERRNQLKQLFAGTKKGARFDSHEHLTNIRKQYLSGADVSTLDVDQLKDAVDVLYRHRRSRRTVYSLDSTADAVVRTCAHFVASDVLVRLLADPINYGVLPQTNALNAFIDQCLEAGNVVHACRMAAYLMQQEILGDSRISTYLSLIACTRWARQQLAVTKEQPTADSEKPASADSEASLSDVWTAEPPADAFAGGDTDDAITLAVPYLKNASYDYHFDLTHPEHLVGKTLMRAADCLPSSSACKLDCSLLGAALFEQPNECIAILKVPNAVFDADVLAAVGSYIARLIAPPLEKKDADDEEVLQVLGEFKHPTSDDWQPVIVALGFCSVTLADRLVAELSSHQHEWESSEIDAQRKLFAEWQQRRRQLLDVYHRRTAVREQLTALADERLKLTEQKRVLCFFDNRTALELAAETDTSERVRQEQIVEQQTLSDEAYAQQLQSAFEAQRHGLHKKEQSKPKQYK